MTNGMNGANGNRARRRTSPDDIIDEWANAPEDPGTEAEDSVDGERGPARRPSVIANVSYLCPEVCPEDCRNPHHIHKRFDSLRALVQYGLMTISDAWTDAPWLRGQSWDVPGSVTAKLRAGHELSASDEDIMAQEMGMFWEAEAQEWADDPDGVPIEYDPLLPVRVLPYESFAFAAFWGRAKVKTELDMLVYLNPGLDRGRRPNEPRIEEEPLVRAVLDQWRQYGLRDDDLPALFELHARRVLAEDVNGALRRMLCQVWEPDERREEKIRKYGYDSVADLLIPEDARGCAEGDPDGYRSFLTGLTLNDLLGDPRRVWGGETEDPNGDGFPISSFDWKLSKHPRRDARTHAEPFASKDEEPIITTDDDEDEWTF